jgi:hypothetical protein
MKKKPCFLYDKVWQITAGPCSEFLTTRPDCLMPASCYFLRDISLADDWESCSLGRLSRNYGPYVLEIFRRRRMKQMSIRPIRPIGPMYL